MKESWLLFKKKIILKLKKMNVQHTQKKQNMDGWNEVRNMQ